MLSCGPPRPAPRSRLLPAEPCAAPASLRGSCPCVFSGSARNAGAAPLTAEHKLRGQTQTAWVPGSVAPRARDVPSLGVSYLKMGRITTPSKDAEMTQWLILAVRLQWCSCRKRYLYFGRYYYLGDMVGSVPDRRPKVSITIKWVT